jgi:hypothetical protein
MESRKQAISIRLGASDLRNLRKLSRRLGVRYSDVVRFAVRTTLARLAPLTDPAASGRSLVPVFVEAGADLVRYLDLDVADIEAIINDGALPEQQVQSDDVQLLVMSSFPIPYARLRLASVGNGRLGASGNGNGNGHTGGELEPVAENELLSHSLRKYLYDKYVYDTALSPGPSLSTGVQR